MVYLENLGFLRGGVVHIGNAGLKFWRIGMNGIGFLSGSNSF